MAALLVVSAAQEKVEFDAASIKLNNSFRKGLMINTSKSGEFDGEYVTLRNLIAYAWHLKEFQTVGGAKWVDSDHYDVRAKPTDDGDRSDATNRLRMRTLLAQRFQLVVHTETKEMPIYALVVAGNGPHLEPAKAADARQGIEGNRGLMRCRAVSMKDFAEWGLAPRLGSIVLDQTGLKGNFDFQVQYADDALDPAADSAAPSLPSALQEQLGLKLEVRKAPVQVLVVDHADKARMEN